MLEPKFLMTLVGVLLIAAGLFVFITGRNREPEKDARQNRFEAFGVSVDVSNPSVLLILLGAGLMIAPHLLPMNDLPGSPFSDQEAGMSQAAAPPASGPQIPDASASPAEEPAPSTPDTGESATARDDPPAPAAGTNAVGATAAVSPTLAGSAVTLHPAATVQAQASAPVVRPLAVTAAAAPVTRVATQKRLLVLTQADVSDRSGLSGETAAGYGRKMQRELVSTAQDTFGDAPAVAAGEAVDFRNLLGRRRDKLQALCGDVQARHLLLADLTLPQVFSPIASSQWPEVSFIAIDCQRERARRSDPGRLSPHRLDSFPFQRDLGERARDFLQQNRGLLGG